MFSSIVVPLDLEVQGDRALPFAAMFATGAGIPLELVTVSAPRLPEAVDIYELETRGRATSAMWHPTVLHSDDPAAAIVGFLADRPEALVVMASRARSALGEFLLGSVSETLLRQCRHPIVLVGPNARIDDPTSIPTLIVGVDGRSTSAPLVGLVIAWSSSFGGPRPWLVEVLPLAVDPHASIGVIETCDVHRLAMRLEEHGIAVEWDVAHATDPVDGLRSFADRLGPAVIAVASNDWTDPDHLHLRSVARHLTQESQHPVLVVPAARLTDDTTPRSN